MRKTLILAGGVAVAAIAALAGLGGSDPPPTPPITGAADGPGPGTGSGMTVQPGGVHGGGAQGIVAGAVVETIQVSGYTYLRLETRSGQVWAAVPRTDISVGTHAELRDAALMQSFRSDSLDRTFDEIYFGVLAQPDGASAAAATGSASSHGHAPAPPVDVGKVPPAEGDDARTVAQIFAQRTELSGKRVRLRATVVKVVVGVLGRNWLHLQDGSGSKDQGDHDLVATTLAEPTVGQTVMVEALVTIDKDLGSGYRYSVLLEDATITPEPAP